MGRRSQLHHPFARLSGIFALLSACALATAACSAAPTSGPVIDAIRPSHIPAPVGAQLLIDGAGFRPGDRVSVGGVTPARTAWVNDHLLSVALPGGLPAGFYDVVVRSIAGRQASKRHAVEVDGPPAAALPSSDAPPDSGTTQSSAGAPPPGGGAAARSGPALAPTWPIALPGIDSRLGRAPRRKHGGRVR